MFIDRFFYHRYMWQMADCSTRGPIKSETPVRRIAGINILLKFLTNGPIPMRTGRRHFVSCLLMLCVLNVGYSSAYNQVKIDV